jgi:hypothetical protein
MMTPLSEKILAEYQVRKTKKQKTAFIDFMQSQIPGLQVEQGGFGNNRNLVLGDVKTAKVILGAHYDTCAQLPFPNFISPKNIPLYIGYSLLICIPFGIVAGLINALLHFVTDDFILLYWGTFLPAMALMFFLFMGGKPNPHTANDNTSGIITLCELISSMTEEQKAQNAFVFFDNEENGLLGSSFFCKLHKKDNLKNKLMINYDCVSDGDHMLFVLSKLAMKAHGEAFTAAFPSTEEKTVYIEKSSNTMYPSDQANFPMGVGVAALKKKKFVGLYMNRIHTPKDTVFQEENIQFFVDGTIRLFDAIF